MKFNQKIKEKLIKNKYIHKVTDNQIIYTNEFKILLWKEFDQGKDPKEIFKKYDLDLNIIGKDNPRRLISRIRKEIERKENKDKDIEEIFEKEKEHKETRGRKKKILPKNWEKELNNLSLEEQNKYLKHKIALMEKESYFFSNSPRRDKTKQEDKKSKNKEI